MWFWCWYFFASSRINVYLPFFLFFFRQNFIISLLVFNFNFGVTTTTDCRRLNLLSDGHVMKWSRYIKRFILNVSKNFKRNVNAPLFFSSQRNVFLMNLNGRFIITKVCFSHFEKPILSSNQKHQVDYSNEMCMCEQIT